ncbi:MAG: glycosyltransferase family 4 protein [Chloroflexi bacterium]|nr:glycosyltransferase family 4 protein [Chloroflexota bacterium]
MKLCLASIHPRRLSGQIESLIALATHLESLGHQVVVASAFESDEIGALADDGAASLPAKLRRLWQAMRQVERSAQGADLVHLNLPTPAFAVLADLIRARTGLPVVVGFEAHLADPVQLVRGGFLARDPHFYLPRILINNGLVARCAPYQCERYVVSSRLQRDELLRLGVAPERLQVLANLSNTAKLAEVGQARARAHLGLPDGPLVAYVGHFHHVKGADVLASAFATVLRTHPQARLALAWSGLGERRPIERLLDCPGVSERVIWLGVVDVGALLAATDVLALPYRLTIGQNAFPNVVLEALAVGVPLVTSRLPLLEELLQEEETALLCPADDPASLGQAISQLLSDAPRRVRMRARQRRLAARLEPASLAQRYHELYLGVQRGQAHVLQPAPNRP